MPTKDDNEQYDGYDVVLRPRGWFVLAHTERVWVGGFENRAAAHNWLLAYVIAITVERAKIAARDARVRDRAIMRACTSGAGGNARSRDN